MKTLIITPEENKNDEIKRIQAFVSSGIWAIHIRKPNMSVSEMREYLSLPGENVKYGVLHRHYQLAKEFPVKGLHFSEKARKEGKHLNYKKDNLTFSSSFHKIEAVLNETFPFDYGFISPVFDSISKENYKAAFTKKQLIELNKKSPFPLVALGGITKNKLPELEAMGFWGAAMFGSIWK